MQLDSGAPVHRVVRLLANALLALAEARGLDPKSLRLQERLDIIADRVHARETKGR